LNNTQNNILDASPNNNFKSENHVRCFTHLLNLAARVFLRPFDPVPKKKSGDAATGTAPEDIINANNPDLVLEEELDKMPDLVAVLDYEDTDSKSDEEDSVWDELTAGECQSLLGQTKAIKLIISRVHDSFHLFITLKFFSRFTNSLLLLSTPRQRVFQHGVKPVGNTASEFG
jgi:hypothetical protein